MKLIFTNKFSLDKCLVLELGPQFSWLRGFTTLCNTVFLLHGFQTVVEETFGKETQQYKITIIVYKIIGS